VVEDAMLRKNKVGTIEKGERVAKEGRGGGI